MKYANVSVDILLSTRADWIREVGDIDEELERRGVRAVERPGRVRSVSLVVIAELAKGSLRSSDIAKVTGQSPHACDQMLSKMCLAGELRREARGYYALPRKARR